MSGIHVRTEETRLRFDHGSGRFAIGEIGLHCGDVLELRVANKDGTETWFETRIEHNSAGWYFLHIQPSDPWEWTNFPARRAR